MRTHAKVRIFLNTVRIYLNMVRIYTYNLSFRILIRIGIFLSCKDVPFFDTLFTQLCEILYRYHTFRVRCLPDRSAADPHERPKSWNLS